MKAVNYDFARMTKAINMNLEIIISRNKRLYKFELKRLDDEYNTAIIYLRNLEDQKKGLKYKIHASEIGETINNILNDSAIYQIK